MLFLVKDILDFSQIESKSLVLSYEKALVKDVLKDCVNTLSFKASEKGIALDFF